MESYYKWKSRIMSFISDKRKIPKLWNSVQNNYNNSENLNRIDFNQYPELYTKRILSLQLLKDYKLTYRDEIPEDIYTSLPEKEQEKVNRLGYYQIGNIEYAERNREITLRYRLDNYPVWMLSYIKILPVFELSDAGKDKPSINKSFSCYVDVESIDDIHHDLIIQCSGNAYYLESGTKYIDVILNIKLIIINENWNHEIQNNKT